MWRFVQEFDSMLASVQTSMNADLLSEDIKRHTNACLNEMKAIGMEVQATKHAMFRYLFTPCFKMKFSQVL